MDITTYLAKKNWQGTYPPYWYDKEVLNRHGLIQPRLVDPKTEAEFRHEVAETFKGMKMVFCGLKQGGNWENKKLCARITRVLENKKVQGIDGRPDIIIEHDGLDLSHNHKLVNPFRIECKTDETWKDGIHQATRYKINSSEKYHEEDVHKFLQVAVVTPGLWNHGSFTPQKCIEDCRKFDHRFCQQFDIDRILWKMGVGIVKSELGLMITFNEGDKIRIVP